MRISAILTCSDLDIVRDRRGNICWSADIDLRRQCEECGPRQNNRVGRCTPVVTENGGV